MGVSAISEDGGRSVSVEGGYTNYGADEDAFEGQRSSEDGHGSDRDGETPPPAYLHISLHSEADEKSKVKSMSAVVATTPSKVTSEEKSVEKSEDLADPLGSQEFYFGYTKRQFFMIIAFCLSNFCSLGCSSLHAPFYPKVAKEKGASLTAAGFVFGIFQLTVFIMSLVYGSLLGKVGPKRMATIGIFVMAISSIVFGFLDKVEDSTGFIALSFLVRIIQANGNAAFVTASFAIIAGEFPTSVAKAISYMETAAGLGLICGPAAGGYFYSVGGFLLPFAVMGGLLLLAAVLALFFMPDASMPVKQEGGEKPPSMLTLLAIPTVTLAAFSIFAAACGIGYLLPSLERHVHHHFELPEAYTGLVFVIDGIMYAFFTPMWGWLCDKFGQPRIISLIGSALIIAGFSIIGPVTFLPWTPLLWVTCVGCVVFGLGLGATFVSGFVEGLVDAKSRGFPDDVGTYGLVSGMWFAMMSLGCFVGASAGGTLHDYVGFQDGIYFVLGLQVLVVLGTIGFIIKYKNRPSGSNEQENNHPAKA